MAKLTRNYKHVVPLNFDYRGEQLTYILFDENASKRGTWYLRSFIRIATTGSEYKCKRGLILRRDKDLNEMVKRAKLFNNLPQNFEINAETLKFTV